MLLNLKVKLRSKSFKQKPALGCLCTAQFPLFADTAWKAHQATQPSRSVQSPLKTPSAQRPYEAPRNICHFWKSHLITLYTDRTDKGSIISLSVHMGNEAWKFKQGTSHRRSGLSHGAMARCWTRLLFVCSQAYLGILQPPPLLCSLCLQSFQPFFLGRGRKITVVVRKKQWQNQSSLCCSVEPIKRGGTAVAANMN